MFTAEGGERVLAGAIVGVGLAGEPRASLGARGASGDCAQLEVGEALAETGLEFGDGVEAAFEERARARAFLERRAEIVELAARRGELIARDGERSAGAFGAGLRGFNRVARGPGVLAQFKLARRMCREVRMELDQAAAGRQPFELRKLRTNQLVGFSLLCLPAREIELAFDLAQHVVDAREVFLDPLELALAHLAPPLEQGEAGGLLDHRAQFLRFGLDYFLDSALLNKCVATAVNLRGHEEFGDVFEAARNPVEQVFGVARAIDPAGHRHFAQRRIWLRQRTGVLGLEQQGDFGHAGRRIGVVAGIDEVVGALAAQAGWGLLTEDPANRIDDV